MPRVIRGSGRNRSKRKKPKSKLFLFIKVLLITLFSSSAVVVLTAATFLYRTAAPPEIPVIQPIHTHIAETSVVLSEDDDEEEPLAADILLAPERFTSDNRKELFFTFLIIGLNEGTNANTIMVASFDGISNEAHLISIPRDSLINVNRSIRKLSGAYLTGTLRGGGTEGGVAQMQREVMSVIGFVPDFYVVINYDIFKDIINTIGGIEINVPFHMRYDDPLQNLHIDIPPGLQLMNGQTALYFARFRNANAGFRAITDYQRIENQQKVVNAVLGNLLRPANILRIPEFIDIFNENVHTNLTFENMLWFASQHSNIRGADSLHFHTAPTTGTSGSPMWYELLDAPALAELINQTVNPFEENIEVSDLDIIRF